MQNPKELTPSTFMIPKKPETLGTIINNGIFAARTHLPLLLPFSFLYVLFSTIPTMFYTYQAAHTTVSAEAANTGTDHVVQLSNAVQLSGFFLTLFCFLLMMIFYAAMIYRLNFILENKKDIGFESSLKWGGSKFLRLLGFSILLAVFVGLISLLFSIIPIILYINTKNPIYNILTAVAIFLPNLFIVVKLFFGYFNIILREQTVWGAIKRAWELTSGYWWRTAFIVIVLSLFIGIISSLITLPFKTNIVLALGISIIFSTFIVPFLAGIYLMYFYDLEARKGVVTSEKSIVL